MANVLIGTPAYGSMVHIDYCKSLIEMIGQGHSYTMLAMGNESLITRARNHLLSMFWHNKNYDYLLFIDADIYLSGPGFRQLISWLEGEKNEDGTWKREPVDVVGAGVRLKSHQVVFNFNPGDQQVFDSSGKLLKCKFLGTAVFALSRKAVDFLVEKARKEGRVYDKKSVMGGGDSMEVHEYFDVFRVGMTEESKRKNLENGEKGIYLSEDYWVCTELNEGGIPVWVDTTIRTLHHGNQSFDNAQRPV